MHEQSMNVETLTMLCCKCPGNDNNDIVQMSCAYVMFMRGITIVNPNQDSGNPNYRIVKHKQEEIMQSHCTCAGLGSANTRPHQLCWGDQEVGTAISPTKCSQVAGFIHTTGRSSSNTASLCAYTCRVDLLW